MKPLMSVLVLTLLSAGGCMKLPEEKQMAPPDHDDRYNSVIVQDDEQKEVEKDNSVKFKIPIM